MKRIQKLCLGMTAAVLVIGLVFAGPVSAAVGDAPSDLLIHEFNGQLTLVWMGQDEAGLGFEVERKVNGGEFALVGTTGPEEWIASDTGAPGTVCTYRVREKIEGGYSPYSEEVMVAIPLGGPTDLRLSGVGCDYTLMWDGRLAVGEDGFAIERKVIGSDWIQIASVPADAASYTDSGIELGKAYDYRVRAFKGTVYSEYCDGRVIVSSFYLPAPTTLLLKESGTTVILGWTDNSQNESGFKIERRVGVGGYQQIGVVGPNITNYSDTGLNYGEIYIYRVRAFNGAGDSEYSNELQYMLKERMPVPGTPSEVKTSVIPKAIKVYWTGDGSPGTRYRLEKRIGGGEFYQIAYLQPGLSSYVDTEVVKGETYTYRVRASNTSGESSYSSEQKVLFQGNALIATPTNLTAYGEEAAAVSWTDQANNETGYIIERKIDNGYYVEIDRVAASVTSYMDKKITFGNRISYRVRAYNEEGKSDYSNEAAIDRIVAEKSLAARFRVGSLECYYDGFPRNLDAAPCLRGGRVFLPLRAVADSMGATLEWDDAAQKATIVRNNKKIEVWLGKPTARINGANQKIDPANASVKPIMIPPGRVMLPLRFIAESLGCTIDWIPSSQTISMTGN
ncbi:MAG: stalk domain-containing protein [Solirubrobacterales bacterium]